VSRECVERGFVYWVQDDYAIDQGQMAEDRTTFLDWMNESGVKNAERFLAGETLDDPWERRMTLALCVWRADKCIWRDDQGDRLAADDLPFLAFGRKLLRNGQALLREGYQQDSLNLSEEQQELLWAYRLYAECRILHAPCWPWELGIHEFANQTGDYYPTGKETGTWCWWPMEHAMKSPAYTDAPPADYFRIIQKHSVDEFYQMFAGYEKMETADGRIRVKGKTQKQEEGMVCLAQERGQKPVLLILADAMDCFWARASAVFEHIYQVYGEHLACYWVNIDVGDFLIAGDSTSNFFKPWQGKELPGHAVSLEDRARTAKKLYMTHPHLTFPCLLDDLGDTTANRFLETGGSSAAVLIDKNGALAWQGHHNWEHFANNCPPQRGLCEQFPWANELELEIRALLKNNGLYDPDHPVFPANNSHFATPDKKIPEEMYLLHSRITNIEADHLTVMGRVSTFTVIMKSPSDKEWFNDPHEMKLNTPPGIPILRQGVAIPREELRVGDVIGGGGYSKEKDGSWTASEIRFVETGNTTDTPRKKIGDTYLLARLLENEGTLLRVQPMLPEEKMRGLRFCREAGDRLALTGRAAANLQALEHLLQRKDETLAVRLHPDCLFVRNGTACDVSELQKNDILYVWYNHGDANQPVIDAALIRASNVQ